MGVSLKKISGAAEEIDYPWKEVEQVRARDEYLREQGRSNVSWIGDAAGRGFGGEPAQEDAHLLLNGMAADGERLLPKAVVEGLDLTFSVPKDLSAAHALGDIEIRRRLETVFDRAFERTMEKLEQHLLFVRYGNGHNEAEREVAHASGLVGIRYDHLRSRLADPQNHYHAYISTVVQGPDGQARRMWIRSMRELRRTLGYWHEAFLREAISNEFPGVQWEAVQENGTARLAGFPDSLRDALSKRSQRIKEEVAAWEQQTGRLANSAVKQKITLETRPPKPDVPDHEQWVAEVAALADAHGYTREVLAQQFLAQTPAPERDIPTPQVVSDRLLARNGLTATASFFRDTDVMVGVIQADIPASRVEEYVAAVLADRRAITIETAKGSKYVTEEQVRAEQTIERVVIDGIDAVPRLAATAQDVQSAISGVDFKLNPGQRQVVFAAATSPDRVVLIEAAAGSGKTTSALMMSRAVEARGLGVRGVAPTGIAAVQLAADAEIDARTIHSLRREVEKGGSLAEGGRYQVLIMDEAGMADIWQAQWLFSQVQREDMKLIVMGDSNQLISVEPGGWLGYFTRSGLRPALRLTEVVRQSDERHGRAVLDVARGRPSTWIKYQQDHGNIVHLGAGQEHQYGTRAAELLNEAADRHGWSHVVAITPTNTRRELINESIQQQRLDCGDLGELLAESGEHERFHIGDRLMYVGRNDRRRNLQNGLAGTVIGKTENGDLVIALDDEQAQLRMLTAEHIAQDVRLAYAVTDYKAQATTVQENVIVGAPDEFDLNRGYVAASRPREQSTLLLISDSSPEQALKTLAQHLRVRADDELTIEHIEKAKESQAKAAEKAMGGQTPWLSRHRKRIEELHHERETVGKLDPVDRVPYEREISSIDNELRLIRLEKRDDTGLLRARGREQRAQDRERDAQSLELRKERVRAEWTAAAEQAADEHGKWGRIDRERRELVKLAAKEEFEARVAGRRAPWVYEALGPQPSAAQKGLRQRWHRIGEYLAGVRVDRGITDPADIELRTTELTRTRDTMLLNDIRTLRGHIAQARAAGDDINTFSLMESKEYLPGRLELPGLFSRERTTQGYGIGD